MHLTNIFFTFFSLLFLACSASLPTALIHAELEASNNLTIGALDERGCFSHLWPKLDPSNTNVDGQFCHYNNPRDGNQCILTNHMPYGDPCGYTSLWLWDNNCILIGDNFEVPYGNPFVLDSLLPWTMVFDTVEGGSLGWWYAGRYFGGDGFPITTNCYYTDFTSPYGTTCEMAWECKW